MSTPPLEGDDSVNHTLSAWSPVSPFSLDLTRRAEMTPMHEEAETIWERQPAYGYSPEEGTLGTTLISHAHWCHIGTVTGRWAETEKEALRKALTKLPLGTADRWVKAAAAVPGRSVSDVMQMAKEGLNAKPVDDVASAPDSASDVAWTPAQVRPADLPALACGDTQFISIRPGQTPARSKNNHFVVRGAARV